MLGRGGQGGIDECRPDLNGDLNDDCKMRLGMRGCDDNSLFQKYSATDIIIADKESKCKSMVPNYNMFKNDIPFTHQAVIVGWGSQSIFEYVLVK